MFTAQVIIHSRVQQRWYGSDRFPMTSDLRWRLLRAASVIRVLLPACCSSSTVNSIQGVERN